MMPSTHEERCRSIVEMLMEGSLIPRRQENTFAPETKNCLECGQQFEGNYKKDICSKECREARDGSQSRRATQNKAAKRRRERE